jgi:hypothetical protein
MKMMVLLGQQIDQINNQLGWLKTSLAAMHRDNAISPLLATAPGSARARGPLVAASVRFATR